MLWTSSHFNYLDNNKTKTMSWLDIAASPIARPPIMSEDDETHWSSVLMHVETRRPRFLASNRELIDVVTRGKLAIVEECESDALYAALTRIMETVFSSPDERYIRRILQRTKPSSSLVVISPDKVYGSSIKGVYKRVHEIATSAAVGGFQIVVPMNKHAYNFLIVVVSPR